MGYIRNIQGGFFQRSYSIYSRMAVVLNLERSMGLFRLVRGPYCGCPCIKSLAIL